MDKVSIIVPVYNVGQYLTRTITAVLDQTYQNWELILVNDCSKDDSSQIMKAFQEKDPRVRCFFQEVNQGVSAARNWGLEEATGEWICFCDGDDWYEPQFLEKMVDCARKEKADYVICDYQVVSDGKMPIKAGTTDGLCTGCDPRLVIACGSLSSCTHMFHRSLFEKSGIRYPIECRQYEEMPVVPVLAKYASKIGVQEDALYNYYQRGNGASASNMAVDYTKNFRIAHDKMAQALGSGYEKELEYHAIYALHYGEILTLCKQKADRKTILSHIHAHEETYPDYRENPYLKYAGRAKKMFLLAERMRLIFLLRAFAALHSRCVG